MGKSQRTKGAQGERELAGKLTELLGGQVVKRELSQTRDGGCDLVLKSTAGDVHVECKRAQVAGYLQLACTVRGELHEWGVSGGRMASQSQGMDGDHEP